MDEEYWTDRRANPSAHDLETPYETDDRRTPYERDYSRVIHSSAFRRLQSKTQVLGLGDSDFYRTRLTHSMEVSQIGVSITKTLFRNEERTQQERDILPHPMLMRTICTAHDIGHPPFGHGGEIALNRCMLPYGGFEGNGQTLRILTKLEPYHQEYGMNLTRRAILGVIKYPAPYGEIVDWSVYPDGEPEALKESEKSKGAATRLPGSSIFAKEKFKPPKCYHNEEHDDVVLGWVAKDLPDWKILRNSRNEPEDGKHPKTLYKSLDTSIMELADDIAYGVHDLEDAVGLKLITPEEFRSWFMKSGKDKRPHQQWLVPFLREHHDDCFDDFVNRLFLLGTESRKKVIGHLVGFFISRVELVNENCKLFSDPIFTYQAIFSDPVGKMLKVLKDVVVELVIKSTPVQQLEFKGQKIVTELFAAFATDPKRLLDKRDFEKSVDGGGDIPMPRVICDYIAGMTDEYATQRYQQLFEPRIGSVFDRL